ncbi:Translation machinery-associated protein 22 [Ceratobasidium sp. 395]|nr:Translation machinery-associated protein 22 [Ceratobasidium sp. 395]
MPKGRQNAPAPVVEETNVPSGSGPVIQPVHVLYCSVCSLPPEYCEFGSSVSKCKAWLQEEHPDLFDKYYSEDALQQKAEALSLEAQAKLDKKAASMEAKADVKAEADSKKKKAAKVTIKRIEPTVHILNPSSMPQTNYLALERVIHAMIGLLTPPLTPDVDLKKAAKLFAQKFATGASVTKNPQGQDEIVVQGDVTDDIVEMIEEQVGVLKGVPEDNVVCIEEKKKKAAE